MTGNESQREKTAELESQILQTSEQEKQRIGRDLHDNLGPYLASVAYSASSLMDELRLQNNPEAENAEQLCAMATGALSLTRDLAQGIFPVQMDKCGLSAALENLAGTTSRIPGISVSFRETGDTHVADPEKSMHFYSIAQEALHNARKHGGASSVAISLDKSEHALHLSVADNGRGMAPSSHDAKRMGLHTMRHRARVLGSELQITATEGGGTTVSCEMPDPAPNPEDPAA